MKARNKHYIKTLGGITIEADIIEIDLNEDRNDDTGESVMAENRTR